MEKVWEYYISGKAPLNMKMREAYSKLYMIPEKYIEIKDINIKDYVEECVNSLLAEGYNIDTAPVSFLQQEFIKIPYKITASPDYIQLSESLEAINEQIDSLQNAPERIINTLISTRNKIVNAIKEIDDRH